MWCGTGVGRIDVVENRFIGIKSRGIYETPGCTILWQAHLDLEGLCMDKRAFRVKSLLGDAFADACYNGLWFSPEMEVIMAGVDKSQEMVTGSVKLRLYKGVAYTYTRTSPFSLYSEELSSMDVEGGFCPQDSTGFINIQALRLKSYAAAKALGDQ